MTFDDLGLIVPLLEALRVRGFETPTPIQAEMIPFLLAESRDVTGLAQTGTGKTAAFGLPILQKLNLAEKRTQALIIAPTRELAMQVSREITDYGQKLPGLKTTTVYGGAAFGPQIRDLRAGAHIITATPGRLKDLLDRGIADLSSLKYLVLDEADLMLDMGFKDDLDTILKAAGPQRQTLLFSATMPPEVARIATNYMKDPHEIVAGERNKGTTKVDHRFYTVRPGDKYAALRRLIDVHSKMYGIIFCRTREAVKDVAHRLSRDGHSVDALHGELSQVQRESVMRRFRQRNPALLVATDVAARGLDVDDLSHVVHFDLPDDIVVYNHRSGRTGRAGKSGSSLALVNIRENHKIRRIEKILGRTITEDRIPGGEEVCKQRLVELVSQVTKVEVNNEELNPYLDAIRDELKELDREDLLRRFVSVEFNRFLKEYGKAPDLNPPPPPKRSRRDVEVLANSGHHWNSRPTGGMVRFRINLGRRQSVLPPQIIGLINQATRSRDIHIGRIDINTDWSEIQVETSMADKVEHSLQNYEYRGTRIRIDRSLDGRDRRGRPAGGHKSRHSSHADRRSKSGSKFRKKHP